MVLNITGLPSVIVALTGLPIGYSVIVALTGLPIGYSVIVALTGLPMGYSVIVALTGLPMGYSVIVALTGLPMGYSVIVALTGLPRQKYSRDETFRVVCNITLSPFLNFSWKSLENFYLCMLHTYLEY